MTSFALENHRQALAAAGRLQAEGHGVSAHLVKGGADGRKVIADLRDAGTSVNQELQVAADVLAGQEVRRIAEPAQQACQVVAVGLDALGAVKPDLHLAHDDPQELGGCGFLAGEVDDGVAGGEVVFDALAGGVAAPRRNVRLAVVVSADAKGPWRRESNHVSVSRDVCKESVQDYHVPVRPV